MTSRFRLLLIALAFAGACTSDSTAPINAGSDAARAADQFAHLADSVRTSGGDSDMGGAYSAIAATVRAGGRVSPITLTIDGVATAFDATISVTEFAQNVVCVRAPCPAVVTGVMRTLVAWDKANPKRVVQITSASDADPIAAMLYPSLLAIYTPMASLIYMDGSAGIFFGTSGTQKLTESNTKALCPSGVDSTKATAGLRAKPVVCTLTDAVVTFDGRLEPALFHVANNTAKGAHTIAMAPQTVSGAHLQVLAPLCDSSCTGGPNAPPPPPVVVRPTNELPASLTATVDSLVTLTLTVKNPSAQPMLLSFPSGQKYDFVVTDSSSGREVWHWAEGRAFTMAMGEQTVPANGSVTFTESWKPAGRGLYLVHAILVSLSHRAEAYQTVQVR